MNQDVLNDAVLSDFPSRHVGSVLKLSKQLHLGSLVIHHGW